MKEDVHSNIDKIVQEVDQEGYVECMSYYSSKQTLHETRLESLGCETQRAKCTSAS